jgi:hypothetical protein
MKNKSGPSLVFNSLAHVFDPEFQKILHHSGIVRNCWTGALARLGVASAQCAASENHKAPMRMLLATAYWELTKTPNL